MSRIAGRAVAGAFLAHFVVLGNIYSFTVFSKPVAEDLDVSVASVSVVVSVNLVLMLVTSKVGGVLAARLVRPIAAPATGAALVVLGVASLVVTRNLVVLYLGFGVVYGVGAGLIIVPAVAAVVHAAQQRIALATGLAVAGAGVGSVVLAPIAAVVIDQRDWRAAAAVLAALAVPVLALAVWLLAAGERNAGDRVVVPSASTRVDTGRLRRDPVLRIMNWSTVLVSFGLIVPFVYLAPFAEDEGLTTAHAAALVAVLGGTNTIGRVAIGLAADRLGRTRMLITVSVAVGTLIAVWPWARGSLALTLFTVCFGLAAGGYFTLLPAITGDYFRGPQLAAATGSLYFASTPGTLVGPPAFGFLVESTDGYGPAAVTAAIPTLAGALLLVRLTARGQPQRDREHASSGRGDRLQRRGRGRRGAAAQGSGDGFAGCK